MISQADSVIQQNHSILREFYRIIGKWGFWLARLIKLAKIIFLNWPKSTLAIYSLSRTRRLRLMSSSKNSLIIKIKM